MRAVGTLKVEIIRLWAAHGFSLLESGQRRNPWGPTRQWCHGIQATTAATAQLANAATVGQADPPSPRLVSCQLGQLNEVAAGVVQHGNGRGGHIGRRHRELGAASLDLLVVAPLTSPV